VKKVIGLGLLLVGCRSSMGPKQAPAPGAPGAPSPSAAVTAFMDGVKAGDLQAISAVWGTTAGSIRNDISEPELSKREIYIISCTKHDKFKINNETPGPAGERTLAVDITRGALTRSTNFHVVSGPQNRWYVLNLDVTPALDDICKAR
jgi:hypothetical protein